jgi:hypothetical protein
MEESYYVIRDLLSGGFWNDYEKKFEGINYAYKLDLDWELAFNDEFQKARKASKCGVELVRVYV